MLLVFASAKLLSEACERFGQPGIAGEILAGILIGPQVLGWMSPNDVLRILSDLGVMFLLFRVGLEVKASDLMSVGITAQILAARGFLATRSAQVILAAAVIDDILGLVVLALVSGVAKGKV